jgi:rubrerythrin
VLSHIYRKLAHYEYSLSNFYKKISRRDDEYSSFFNQLSIDEKRHSKMLFALLDKRKKVIPTKYLIEAIEYNNETTKSNSNLSTRNPLFYLIFRGKNASSYSTKELLSFISNGEKVAYIYYSILLYIVKFLSLITKDKLYELDIKILNQIREEENIHSKGI